MSHQAGPSSWSRLPREPRTIDDAELDAMFEGVDDLPVVDFDAIEREARAKYASNVASGDKGKKRRVNVLLSDDDEPQGGADHGKGKGKGAEKDDEEDEKKKNKRRPVVKLDASRLTGPNGFPALIEQHKKFKPTGKGNEAQDLKRLLQMYQLWAHKMYPKTQFRDTAEKIQKLCHSREMQRELKKWKGEDPKSKENDAGSDNDASDNDNDEGAQPTDQAPASSPSSSPAPEPRPTRTAATEDWLNEAIAQDAAARGIDISINLNNNSQHTTAGSGSTTANPESSTAPQGSGAGDDEGWGDMDIDELIAQDEAEQARTLSVAQQATGDKDIWDEDFARELGL